MAPLVSVAGVTQSFGGVPVLQHLSLEVVAGEALGIVGPNGAGKTTLLNVIAGDLRPDKGTVTFDGRDVTGEGPDQRCRAGIARTSQIPRPFESLTVYENVLTAAVFGTPGRKRESRSADLAVESMRRSGLLAKANTPAANLALLDRKRLELSRALATQPRLLLLDEIAGGLTEAEVRVLIDEIRQIQADGVTIVWIEHIVHALLAVVGRIMAMSFGRKIAEGDAATVMRSAAVREVYLGVGGE